MGLDCSHDAWHGAYSAFHRWRSKIAEVAGLPPLDLMSGFYNSLTDEHGLPTLWQNPKSREDTSAQRLDALLPIKWECLKPDYLYYLLSHSDCDGEIVTEYCAPIADRLEQLLPLLPQGDEPGHIGNWRDKTQKFIDGLRAAAAAEEPLTFG